MRVGYIHDWKSNWFNEKNFAEYLAEDVRIREHITNKLAHAGLSSITIRKDSNELEVNIHTARPGIVIGKSGSEVDALRRDLHKMTNKQIKVNILEIKRPELDASLVAQSANWWVLMAQRNLRRGALRCGRSGLAKMFHTPRSALSGSAATAAMRKVSVASGCSGLTGR